MDQKNWASEAGFTVTDMNGQRFRKPVPEKWQSHVQAKMIRCPICHQPPDMSCCYDGGDMMSYECHEPRVMIVRELIGSANLGSGQQAWEYACHAADLATAEQIAEEKILQLAKRQTLQPLKKRFIWDLAYLMMYIVLHLVACRLGSIPIGCFCGLMLGRYVSLSGYHLENYLHARRAHG